MLETERLELIPLSAKQLVLWLYDKRTLEEELNCKCCKEPMGFFRDIVQGQISKTENDPDNYLYHSFWFIIRKSDRVMVGSCDFKGVPDINHEVEIGYGLYEGFEGMGYMTEAIGLFCKWAMDKQDIDSVIAETENDNPKSENVLRRVGFYVYKRNETTWWRLPGRAKDSGFTEQV